MRAWVLFNAKAGSAGAAGEVREVLKGLSEVTLCEPESAEEAAFCAAEAVAGKYDLVVVAGGDGTLHTVVNALAPNFDRVPLAVLPLGTGNDFRRTLAIPEDPLQALGAILNGEVRSLDLIRAETATQSIYCVNVAAGGFSGQMQEALTPELKATWGPLAYLRGAVEVLPDLTDYETDLTLDDGPPERVDALNVIVANGRSSGRGFQVASRANPEDGLLDVVVVRQGSLFDLTAVAAQLVATDYLNSDQVVHRRARSVHVRSRPGMWFSIDGELWTNEPVTFRVLPGALRVVVGPDYRAEVGEEGTG